MDWAANYGVFDYATPNFTLRFTLGKTDYILGVFFFEDFLKEYDRYGSTVYEQHLNLTKQEKERIYAALYKNALPQNREYRYNFFYDNCTIRARNLILSNLNGRVKWQAAMDEPAGTFRSIVHRYNANNPWSRFGSDLLLGIGADKSITREAAQFIPDNLKDDFSRATILDSIDNERPLVSETTVITPTNPPMRGGSFPVNPLACALMLLFLTIVITIVERIRNRTLWGYDLAMMLLTGFPGLILLFMVFSEHPTVSLNLQILILNPLSIIFGIPALKRLAQRRRHMLWPTLAACLQLGIGGALIQQYAEGIIIIGLAMLIRTATHTCRMYIRKPSEGKS